MKKRMFTFRFILSLTAVVLCSAAQAQIAPRGWKTEQTAEGVTVYTPPNLKPGEVFSIAFYPEQPLDGKEIEDWLQLAIPQEPAQPGTLLKHGVDAKSANVAVGIGGFTAPDGAKLYAFYTALSVDRENVRVMRMMTLATAPLSERYKAETAQFGNVLAEMAKRDAIAAGRGIEIQRVTPAPRGMTPGGAIVEGIYTGSTIQINRGNEVYARYRLYLYANGEYRLLNSAGEQLEHGAKYTYDSRTGMIDIGRSSHNLYNDYGDGDLSFYGRDAEGKPYIHAEVDSDYNPKRTTLRYAGAVDRPAPEVERQAELAAEAEANRYKFTVAPGAGLKQSEIAGILLNQTGRSDGMGYSITSDIYLLLADGTVYNNLPVAPDEIDVPLSRRKEPEKWGRWRKQGNQIVAAWRDKPNEFTPLPGELAVPARKGDRMQSRFGSASSSGGAGFGFGSYSYWGVTFTPDGRFEKDSRGGSSSGNTGLEGQVAVNTAYDDSGTYVSATGNGVGFSSINEKKKGGDRSGTYTVDSYAITLKYDDGSVVRQPFFFGGDDRKSVWFEGALLRVD